VADHRPSELAHTYSLPDCDFRLCRRLVGTEVADSQRSREEHPASTIAGGKRIAPEDGTPGIKQRKGKVKASTTRNMEPPDANKPFAAKIPNLWEKLHRDQKIGWSLANIV
jgi:hypothetical protein